MQHQNVVLEAGAHQKLHYVTFKKYDPYFKDVNDYYNTPSPKGLNPETEADWFRYKYLINNP